MTYEEQIQHRADIQTPEEKLERLTNAAEKVYQLRTEAPAGENFVEFYYAVLSLGRALNINRGFIPREEDRGSSL